MTLPTIEKTYIRQKKNECMHVDLTSTASRRCTFSFLANAMTFSESSFDNPTLANLPPALHPVLQLINRL